MGNQVKGIVDLRAGEDTYRLHYTTNAICELEDVAGMGIAEFMAQRLSGDKVGVKDFRLMVWAGLIEHHADVDLKKAGQIIDQAGGMAAVSSVFEKAFASAMPEPDKDAAGNGAGTA